MEQGLPSRRKKNPYDSTRRQRKETQSLFNYLQEDKHCLGGAIAVPFKEKVFSFIESNLQKR